jgi:ribosome-associated translation inhibitor RaiA
MAAQLQIAVREMPHSEALEAVIRRKAAGLERVHPRITAVRTTVSAPHHHHRQGNLFTVKLDVTFPGGEILVNRDHAEDVYVALRDAFLAARRQLVASARRGQGDGKSRRRSGSAASRAKIRADE